MTLIGEMVTTNARGSISPTTCFTVSSPQICGAKLAAAGFRTRASNQTVPYIAGSEAHLSVSSGPMWRVRSWIPWLSLTVLTVFAAASAVIGTTTHRGEPTRRDRVSPSTLRSEP